MNLCFQAATLTEQLTSLRAERDALLLEKEVSIQRSTEELLSRVTSVSQERDELQEALEALRQDKQQLRAELEERMEMVFQSHLWQCVAAA